MSDTINSNRGFTLVELLIVIVVIAILAAISIVTYNGIQNRARNTAAQTAADTIAKKAEMANTITGSYPVALTGTNSFATNTDTSLAGSGLILADIASTAPTNTNTVDYEACSTGARVARWDYSTKTKSAWRILGSACPAYTAVTGTP